MLLSSFSLISRSTRQKRHRVHFALDCNTYAATYSSTEYNRSSLPESKLSREDVQEFLVYRTLMNSQIAQYHYEMHLYLQRKYLRRIQQQM